MKRRIISMVIALCICIGLFSGITPQASAAKNASEITQQIKNTYSDAVKQYGGSFNGYCNKYVDYQLKILGIDNSMIGYNGNGYWDYYKGKTKTSGGYNINIYPASSYNIKQALNAITSNGTVNAYNIMLGFQIGYDGGSAGHVMFIHAIINGKVYFSESYGCNYDGTYYAEGAPTTISIDTFHNFYTKHYGFEGMIHFTTGSSGGSQTQSYYLDVNWTLNGVTSDNSAKFATCDVYINGSRVADDVSDYYVMWPTGTRYEVKDIKTANGYSYEGPGSYSGTVGNDYTSVWLYINSNNTFYLTLSRDSVSIQANQTAYVTVTCQNGIEWATFFEFSVENSSIASISNRVVGGGATSFSLGITGLKAGSTRVHVKLIKDGDGDGYSSGQVIDEKWISVTVSSSYSEEYAYLSWLPDSLYLETGYSETLWISADANLNNQYQFWWHSENTNIAIGEWGERENGQWPLTIRAKGRGTTTITVSLRETESGKEWDSWDIQVYSDQQTVEWTDGYFYIEDAVTGIYAGNYDEQMQVCASTDQWPIYDTRQMWYIERQNDGTFTIQSVYDNGYLTFGKTGEIYIKYEKDEMIQRWNLYSYLQETVWIAPAYFDDMNVTVPSGAEVGTQFQSSEFKGTNFYFWGVAGWDDEELVEYYPPIRPRTPDPSYEIIGDEIWLYWPTSPLTSPWDDRLYKVEVFDAYGYLIDDYYVWDNEFSYEAGDNQQLTIYVTAVNCLYDFYRVPNTMSAPGVVTIKLNGGTEQPNLVNITLNANGGILPDTGTNNATYAFIEGSNYSFPSDPVRNGYQFQGWFTKSSGGQQIRTTDLVSVNMNGSILYAHWAESTCPHNYRFNVTAPTCTAGGYTTFTCSICGDSYKSDFTAALGHNYIDGYCTRCGAKDPQSGVGPFRFDDVRDSSKFYFDPVYWAFNAKPQITNGMDATHFGPNAGCTRGQVVTFLWRAAGCPAPRRLETAFTDVSPEAFYAKAVAWAVENGITNGMSATSFAPNNTCTRGQIVTFLWRFRGEPEPAGTDTGFTDVPESAFYAKAVAWAVEAKVTNGMTAATFAPNATCTRGQIVTFLYRAMSGK